MMRTLLTATALAVALLAQPVAAADCSWQFKSGPSYKGMIEMPPERYWAKPKGPVKRLTCAQLTFLFQDPSNKDCHLTGVYWAGSDNALTNVRAIAVGLEVGDIGIWDELTGVCATMATIHERGHQLGWHHGTGRFVTPRQWVADPRVPDWAKE